MRKCKLGFFEHYPFAGWKPYTNCCWMDRHADGIYLWLFTAAVMLLMVITT